MTSSFAFEETLFRQTRVRRLLLTSTRLLLIMPKMGSCAVCNDNTAKYRCPGCSTETCSLVCVNEHKTTQSCSGMRNQTAYVPANELDDRLLMNDYRFLENASRKSDAATRDPLKTTKRVPKFCNIMLREAKKKGIHLKLLPYPMSKRKENKTYFSYKNKKFEWYLKCEFPQIGTQVLSSLVDEDLSLADSLHRLLDSQNEQKNGLPLQKIRQYIENKDLHIFMKVEGSRANDVKYHKLDLASSIMDNLKGKTIIEYPTFQVAYGEYTERYRKSTLSYASSSADSESDSSDTSGMESSSSDTCKQDQTQNINKTDSKLNVQLTARQDPKETEGEFHSTEDDLKTPQSVTSLVQGSIQTSKTMETKDHQKEIPLSDSVLPETHAVNHPETKLPGAQENTTVSDVVLSETHAVNHSETKSPDAHENAISESSVQDCPLTSQTMHISKFDSSMVIDSDDSDNEGLIIPICK